MSSARFGERHFKTALANGSSYDKNQSDDKMSSDDAMRKSFAFGTVVTIVFGLALGNLILTVSIMSILKLGRGMEHLQLVPEAHSIRFHGDTFLDRIYKRDGRLEGFSDVPVTITGDNSAAKIALLRANGHAHSRLVLSRNGTTLHGFHTLDLNSPLDGQSLFSVHRPTFKMPGGGGGAKNVRAKQLSTGRLTSAIGQSLNVSHARDRLLIRGTEGVQLRSSALLLHADQNVALRSLNGSLVLSASNGVRVAVDQMPIVGEHGIRLDNRDDNHYKLCVCMPQGLLFRVPVASMRNAGNTRGLCSIYVGTAADPCAADRHAAE